MQTEPPGDYLLPKRLRQLFWIIGALAFYGQFTLLLLAGVAISGGPKLENFSAWLTLRAIEGNTSAKLLIAAPDGIAAGIPSALVGAAIGTFTLFLLAILRHTRFLPAVLLLCIPISMVTTLKCLMGIQGDFPDQVLIFFDSTTIYVAESQLEKFLGIILPLCIYAMSFLLAFATGLVRIGIRTASESSKEGGQPD